MLRSGHNEIICAWNRKWELLYCDKRISYPTVSKINATFSKFYILSHNIFVIDGVLCINAFPDSWNYKQGILIDAILYKIVMSTTRLQCMLVLHKICVYMPDIDRHLLEGYPIRLNISDFLVGCLILGQWKSSTERFGVWLSIVHARPYKRAYDNHVTPGSIIDQTKLPSICIHL